MLSAYPACVVVLLAIAAGGLSAQGPVPDPSLAAPATAAAAPTAVRAGGAAFRPLAAGDRVRVVSAAGRYAGTVSRVNADTVVVGAAGRLDAIPRTEVTRLERFAGRSSRGRAILLGAGAGLVSGGALGGIAGRMAGRVRCGPGDESCTPGGHDRTIQGALLADGVIIGALVGAMLGPTFRREHWERAEGGFPVEAAHAPGGGIAAGISLRL
jgi:hypothetical protein